MRVTDGSGNSATDSRTWDYGTWYQTNAQVCSARCTAAGKVQALSPGGGYCVSGERQTASATALITYTYGVWGVPGDYATNSVGGYCYDGGQTQDADGTDLTVGCFCK